MPILLGWLFNMAFQPWGIWPCAIVALSIFPLFRHMTFRQRWFFGWMTGFWIQAFGYYWIFLTIRDFGGLHTVLSGVGAILFWGYQGLDLAIWFALTGFLVARDRWGLFMVFDAGLLFIIQSYLFPYVFPWALSACLSSSVLAGSAYYWSGYGLTFWMALLAFSLSTLVKSLTKKNLDKGAFSWSIVGSVALLTGFLIPPTPGPVEVLKVGVVQPNIIPWAKRDRQSFKKTFDAHVLPSVEFGKKKVDLIIWPETALSIQLKNYPAYQQYLSDMADTFQAGLMIGCLGKNERGYTNEIWLFSPNAPPQIYQKEKLVMFSESLPWPFFWAKYFVDHIGGFAPGTQNHVLMYKGIAIQPLVCFEAILPNYVKKTESQLMVNLTNDAWFGETKASALHLEQLQMRSIERQAPLVRAANSGISCWVSIDGKIQEPTPVYKQASPIYDIPIPKSVSVNKWFWTQWLLVIVTGVIFLGSNKKNKKK